MVLEEDTWNVISLSLFKFYEHHSLQAPKLDLKSVKLVEKVDGVSNRESKRLWTRY